MKECWSEGDLRAYQDGELLPADMERVAAHLAECPQCEALADEVAGRAARVAKLMAALPEPRQVMWMPRQTSQPARAWPKWAAVAAALAAGTALAIWLVPRDGEPAVPTEVVRPPMASFRPEPARPEVIPAAAGAPAPVRRPVRKPRVQDVFLALDDEPFETGVVMRVALGEAEIPAEVVFGRDGRPRAVRLVSNISNH